MYLSNTKGLFTKSMGNMEAIEFLIGKLRETKNNAEFFDSMNKSA